MNRVVIIDGDELAFRVAAACETRSITAVLKEDVKVSYTYDHRTAFKEFLKDPEQNTNNYTFEDFYIADNQKTEPLEFSLNTIKNSIKNILEACNTDKYEIYLSGVNNFRDKLPLPTQYKSGRKANIRPLLLTEVRNYLEKHHNAQIVNNYEVDEKLIMRCLEGNKVGDINIAATQDKDARGCNDIHLYNPVKGTMEYIQGLGKLYLNDKGDVKGEGFKWLCFQWVFGDPTDTYKPCELAKIDGKKVKFGEKSAYKLLVDCKTSKDCVKAVHDQYKTWYPEPFKYNAYDGTEIEADYVFMMQLYLDCCRMLRWEGDYVNVKELLTKMEINYGKENN